MSAYKKPTRYKISRGNALGIISALTRTISVGKRNLGSNEHFQGQVPELQQELSSFLTRAGGLRKAPDTKHLFQWSRDKRGRSKWSSVTSTEAEAWGAQLAEAGGRDTECGGPLFLGRRCHWQRDDELTREVTGGFTVSNLGRNNLDRAKIMKKRAMRSGQSLREFVPRISFEEAIPYSPPLPINHPRQMMGLSPSRESDFKMGRCEVLSVYLEVKYKTSGTP